MKIASLAKVTAWLALCGLVGCKTSLQAQERPAVIGNSEPEAYTELEQVVTGALDGVPVTLADDAFARTDRLIVERRKHETLEGGVLDGRSYEFPEHFRLVIKDTTCILIHEKTDMRYRLKNVKCRAFK